MKNTVSREVLQEAFSTLGHVRQVDLVPKGDHNLVFIHFHSWSSDSEAARGTRARLLNPPHSDYKESLAYAHPTMGRQRLLFARSRMSIAGAVLRG